MRVLIFQDDENNVEHCILLRGGFDLVKTKKQFIAARAPTAEYVAGVFFVDDKVLPFDYAGFKDYLIDELEYTEINFLVT